MTLELAAGAGVLAVAVFSAMSALLSVHLVARPPRPPLRVPVTAATVPMRRAVAR